MKTDRDERNAAELDVRSKLQQNALYFRRIGAVDTY